MQRTIGYEALLTKTLHEITEVSYHVFQTSIEAHSKGLAEIPLVSHTPLFYAIDIDLSQDLDDTSLTPPHFILDHAQVLREVMNVYQSSLLEDSQYQTAEDDTSAPGSTTISFEKILDIVIDPVVLACISKSEEKMRLRPKWDGKIYTINCLTYLLVRPLAALVRDCANVGLQSLLEPYSFTKGKQGTLNQVIGYRVTELIEGHFTDLMTEAGLLSVYVTVKTPPTDVRALLPTALLLYSAGSHRNLYLASPKHPHSPCATL
jgi:conserved oligomeric Golgi complex subunit 6